MNDWTRIESTRGVGYEREFEGDITATWWFREHDEPFFEIHKPGSGITGARMNDSLWVLGQTRTLHLLHKTMHPDAKQHALAEVIPEHAPTDGWARMVLKLHLVRQVQWALDADDLPKVLEATQFWHEIDRVVGGL